MSKIKNPRSRWVKGNVRHPTNVRIATNLWVRDRRGNWRFETEAVPLADWFFMRREGPGWFHGARVRVRA